MLIDAYNFGKIIINGEIYHTDVIVFPNRVRDEWWRQRGHQLLIEDLKCIIDADPEVLIVELVILVRFVFLQRLYAT